MSRTVAPAAYPDPAILRQRRYGQLLQASLKRAAECGRAPLVGAVHEEVYYNSCRLKAAAERRGLSLEFIRTRGDAIRFKVVGDGTEVFAPAEEEQEELAVAG